MRNHLFSFAATALCACFYFVAGPAFAATITVTTVNDEFNTDGDCSLREAVRSLNSEQAIDSCAAGDGNDTITFAAALAGQTIVLDKVGGDFSGDLDIRFNTPGSLTIAGPLNGGAAITIDGNMVNGDCASADRVLDVSAPAVSQGGVSLVLRDLIITHGCVQSAQGDALGGGIRINAPITSLTLTDVVISDNRVASGTGRAAGGGLYADIESGSAAAITIENSLIAGNEAIGSSSSDFNGAAGGGVYFNGAISDLSVTGSEFQNNSATADDDVAGGGLYLESRSLPSPQTFSIATSQFSANTLNGGEASGGGAYLSLRGGPQSSNSISITDTAFNGNSAETDNFQGGPLSGVGLYISASSVSDLTLDGIEASRNTTAGTPISASGLGAYLDLEAGGASSAFPLSITNSEFNDNATVNAQGVTSGVGLYISADGVSQVEFDKIQASGNAVTEAPAIVRGGGAFVDLAGGQFLSTFTLSITQSEFSNNTNAASSKLGGSVIGGGLRLIADQVGVTTIASSTWANNSFRFIDPLWQADASLGGGASLTLTAGSAEATLEIRKSRFVSNQITFASSGSAFGAGLALGANNFDKTTLALNVFSNNSLESMGAVLGAGAFLAIGSQSSSYTLTISRSEFSQNQAISNGQNRGGTGGGLYVAADACTQPPCVTLKNSTVSGNSVSPGSGGGFSVGRANGQTPLSVVVNNATIVNNEATAGGGGLLAGAGAAVTLSNTIIANNTAANAPDCFAPNIDGTDGDVVSAGYNLIGNGNGCGLTAQTGDQIGNITTPTPIDPQLGPLVVGSSDSGVPTRYHIPQPGSRAIDAGNPGQTNAPACETIDQRGELRPLDGDGDGTAVCDIGSIEREMNEPPVVAGPIDDQTLPVNGGSVTFDLDEVFSDPEGETLTFAAVTNNPNVVTVFANESDILEITPIAAGSTTVEVTATDSFEASVTDTVAVTVTGDQPGNQPPVLSPEIPNQSLQLNDKEALDLAEFFTDPEGGNLSFSATSSNPEVVSVNLNGSILTLIAKGFGSATITVTATDVLGVNRVVRLEASGPGTGIAPSSGGGCVLAGPNPRGADPLLWLLVVIAGAWRVSGRRRTGSGRA